MILSQKEDIIPIYDRTNREKRTLKTCADVKQRKNIFIQNVTTLPGT